MSKVIKFSNTRIFMFILSAVLILAGVGTTIVRGGFNLGIDFLTGSNQQVRFAPVAFSATYTGPEDTNIELRSNALMIRISGTDRNENLSFSAAEYPTLGALKAAVDSVEGLSLTLSAPESTATTSLIAGLNLPSSLTGETVIVNYVADTVASPVSIDDMRTALSGLGNPDIQAVGAPEEQQFLIRVKDVEGTDNTTEITNMVKNRLLSLASADEIVVLQADYIGPRMSGELIRNSIVLVIVAMLLIMIYITIRFQFSYAVSAMAALVHDVLVVLGFIGLMQIEFSTATIAAVLTIIGYSLNDTIVVFDRVRENTKMLQGISTEGVVNTSITQSLSRTLITSVTTLLAVTALFIFGTGQIKDFALNMIVGVAVGTYSSIFIASPIYLSWKNVARKRAAAKGIITPKVHDEEETPKIETAKEEVLEIPAAERKLKGKRQGRKK